MLPMQASGILLQGSLPRNGHGQHHGIQRRMIKAFTDEPTCSQYYPSRGIGHGLKFFKRNSSLLAWQTPMQDVTRYSFGSEEFLQFSQMACPFRQHKCFASFIPQLTYVFHNVSISAAILTKSAEHLMDAGFRWQRRSWQALYFDVKSGWHMFHSDHTVPDVATLHKYNGMVPSRRCGVAVKPRINRVLACLRMFSKEKAAMWWHSSTIIWP